MIANPQIIKRLGHFLTADNISAGTPNGGRAYPALWTYPAQRELATEIGISPSRINDYITGRSEPTLKIARLLCKVLNITPAAMLQY